MPIIPFDSLPPASRLWIFASDRPLDTRDSERLLDEVDAFLDEWRAHGEPLRAARQWIPPHFLAIGVDPRTANASGCSIDGLFRRLHGLQEELGTPLVGGGRVFYRAPNGAPEAATREEFAELARAGAVSRETPVFDTTAVSVDEFRRGFERPAGETWAARLFE